MPGTRQTDSRAFTWPDEIFGKGRVKGHSRNPDNNDRADALAVQGAQEAAAEHLANELGAGPCGYVRQLPDTSLAQDSADSPPGS
ncbi:hypothetical protein [Actinomadura sp. HBU206391]|uniref:hypothetical protein n=1 Tax=Actinomadura sp. HBU206391 TaxID=2731692 RepID=UPI00164F119B|nr:hypothetical protein [Actinomadura sp. HBU206391]MBC6460375.1 hypothetical protein [Actinomadura sp. HBU206391]